MFLGTIAGVFRDRLERAPFGGSVLALLHGKHLNQRSFTGSPASAQATSF